MGIWQGVADHLSSHSSAYIAAALGVAAVSAAVSAGLFVRLRAITRPLARIRTNSSDAADILPAVLHSIGQAESRLDQLKRGFDQYVQDARVFIKYFGLVRYDAFEDVGGKQSYSMCLLDSDKNGVLLTYLTGRNSTRSYAVTIQNGAPSRKLSDEETKALDETLSRTVVVSQT